MSVWFITGASRGLGAAITRAALDAGHQVAATGRDLEKVRRAFPDAGDALLPVELDVTDRQQIAAAVAAAIDRFGGIDVLVNNAGRGHQGALEELTDQEIQALYAVNVFGLVAVTRAVLPVLRGKGAGTIVNLSSYGGFQGVPGFGAYTSSKFAVEGFTEALRAEVAELGITAGVVEPGDFRTDFLDGTSLTASAPLAAYDGTVVAQMRGLSEAVNHQQPGDPAKAAQIIVGAVDSGAFPERLFVGAEAIDIVTAKLDRVRDEVERQKTVASSTALTEN
ncbi:SDR family NAD(P)-dependent oxidoreductase [Agromyces sp. ISL-38]|uniref:SDR family NAD(P)-dependent oxidoreductase n=1 Tax=Agromyces sp. ISL-38 TaxID=2819107 RepID=UPI001BE6FE66|nr:SDR family NAD(P)-dependent oxidoreductase [Agromyces sp. ISL-38]MBT2498560.1 SDR family NAD(P)-dependent oxidoreductase [Agromyces sp. ISL-38]